MEKNLARHNYPLPIIQEGLTKRQIAFLVESTISRIFEEGNVFEVAEAIAAVEEFIKGLRKDKRYVDYVCEELQKSKGSILTSSGSRIESFEAGTVYDYSNNIMWRELDNQIKELTAKKKSMEEMLRKIPAGKMMVDNEDGEVFYGPAKTSISTYKITLAK